MAASRDFVNRRLHSLLGVLPIGVYFVFHWVANYYALRGPEAYNNVIGFIEELPFLLFLEIFLIYLPLLFHGIYGLYIAFTSTNNVSNHSFFRNIMFLLQRVTGVFTLIFITWHVWETRIQNALGAELNFNMMVEILSNPLMVVFYILGVVAATFHFSNGMWSFLVSWGITVSPRSQVISTYVWMIVFVVMSYFWVRTIFAFV
jgi:succinate dehydrogenase / fumarate reductase cytochrome b subunit